MNDESRLCSGLLEPDKSSGLSELDSARPSILPGDSGLGYFAALDPRSKGESPSIDLFLSTGPRPLSSDDV